VKSRRLPSLGPPAASRHTVAPGAFAISVALAHHGLPAGSRRSQDFSRTLHLELWHHDNSRSPHLEQGRARSPPALDRRRQARPAKDDKQGLGLTTRTKKHFAAQQMVLVLGTLAHNVLVWARA